MLRDKTLEVGIAKKNETSCRLRNSILRDWVYFGR